MTAVRVFSKGREVGLIELKEGSIDVRVADSALASKIRKTALRPLPYLKDEELEGGVKTVKALAQPGTEEHLRILMFELRKIGLEGRLPG
jgi:hypothetical protein